jgi:hypothetical protein
MGRIDLSLDWLRIHIRLLVVWSPADSRHFEKVFRVTPIGKYVRYLIVVKPMTLQTDVRKFPGDKLDYN